MYDPENYRLDNPTLTFGKHAGASLDDLWASWGTRPYVRWLAGYTGVRSGKYPQTHHRAQLHGADAHLIACARRRLRGVCLSCFEALAPMRQEGGLWCARCHQTCGTLFGTLDGLWHP